MVKKIFTSSSLFLPIFLCCLFFIAYSTLSIVRHNHYGSFGYDLGINDQVVWEYSTIHAPITTIDHIVFIPKLFVHVEFIYALISPLYWIWSDPRMLLLIQSAFFCFSGLAVYLLAKKYKLHPWIQIAATISYLMFYGVQNALWFDAHSAPFEAACTMWFVYFLVSQKNVWTIVFFFLAIFGKENVAEVTFLISLMYFVLTRRRIGLILAAFSLIYVYLVFGVFFHFIVKGGYQFANSGGLFAQLNPTLMYDSPTKLQVYWYTLLSAGFLPLLNPFYLIPVLGNLFMYFVVGSKVTTAQGLFLHYRIELAPLISWAILASIATYKKFLNRKYIAVYLVIFALLTQYLLHLPLSYLTKPWFWSQPQAVQNINTVLPFLPKNASVVAQNNIVPHVSERLNIFVLWPETRDFKKNSPCGHISCNWFRWAGNPDYLVADTSSTWDVRHFLTDRTAFIDGLKNLENAHVISPYKQVGDAVLYKVNKNPEKYK